MSEVGNIYKDPQLAALYSKHFPNYPSTLYDKILEYLQMGSECTENRRYKLAVDVACGPGQSTFPLCQYFESVLGLDISEAMIEQATMNLDQVYVKGQGNVTFRVGSAEDLSFLADNSVDLITVGIAMHWFDVEKFCVECHRVLRPGGVLAAYGYGIGTYSLGDSEIVDGTLKKYTELLNEYRDSCTIQTAKKYIGVFPIIQKHFPHTKRDDSIPVVNKFSVEGMLGYLKPFPVYENMRRTHPDMPDPLDAIRDYLLQVYNNNPPHEAVTCKKEIFVIMGKK